MTGRCSLLPYKRPEKGIWCHYPKLPEAYLGGVSIFTQVLSYLPACTRLKLPEAMPPPAFPPCLSDLRGPLCHLRGRGVRPLDKNSPQILTTQVLYKGNYSENRLPTHLPVPTNPHRQEGLTSSSRRLYPN